MGLNELVALSRRYGSDAEYVVGGGGNSSWKDRDSLYVKASGTALAEASAAGFVRLDRSKLAALRSAALPADPADREAAALAALLDARSAGEEGKRPSVETLLHDILPGAYVLHAHPALVNGLTCSVGGEAAARKLFGSSFSWIPATDPGWTLARAVLDVLESRSARGEPPPSFLLLQNHGVFVAADSPSGVDAAYALIMGALGAAVRRRPDVSPLEPGPDLRARAAALAEELGRACAEDGIPKAVEFALDAETARLAASGAAFAAVAEPFTPDHIVYAGSAFLRIERGGDPGAAVAGYRARAGSFPKVVLVEGVGAFGVGPDAASAGLAVALFRDAAKIAVYADSFGGPLPLSAERIAFIEGWEAERYRVRASSGLRPAARAAKPASPAPAGRTIDPERIERAWDLARARYADLGVDAEAALRRAADVPVSVHCWQGDDVAGFEGPGGLSGGGILATGAYPGRARDGDELRSDAELAFSLIPGAKRFNLHALYAETGGKAVPRDELEPGHFGRWLAWARGLGIALDFNPSFFSHPLAASGRTLTHPDPAVRAFWIRHGRASRRIASSFGSAQGGPAWNDVWIPDGSKDLPADRAGPRALLRGALDELLAEALPEGTVLDAVESKLFGIGSEAYVAGSHDFYLGYAARRGDLRLCLDLGHFHPTESVADKISALLPFVPGLLVHASRGLRWDSDHVVAYSDELREVCREIARQDAFGRVGLALDYFDASIDRIAAWAIGGRALRKAVLEACLEPVGALRAAEATGRLHERLAVLEEAKTLPIGAAWDKLCLDAGAPIGLDWLAPVAAWEEANLPLRG